MFLHQDRSSIRYATITRKLRYIAHRACAVAMLYIALRPMITRKSYATVDN